MWLTSRKPILLDRMQMGLDDDAGHTVRYALCITRTCHKKASRGKSPSARSSRQPCAGGWRQRWRTPCCHRQPGASAAGRRRRPRSAPSPPAPPSAPACASALRVLPPSFPVDIASPAKHQASGWNGLSNGQQHIALRSAEAFECWLLQLSVWIVLMQSSNEVKERESSHGRISILLLALAAEVRVAVECLGTSPLAGLLAFACISEGFTKCNSCSCCLLLTKLAALRMWLGSNLMGAIHFKAALTCSSGLAGADASTRAPRWLDGAARACLPRCLLPMVGAAAAQNRDLHSML